MEEGTYKAVGIRKGKRVIPTEYWFKRKKTWWQKEFNWWIVKQLEKTIPRETRMKIDKVSKNSLVLKTIKKR
mgnify:CR=1 FL=1